MRKAKAISLTRKQRKELGRLSKSKRSEIRVAQRAQIILRAAEGCRNDEIGELLGIDRRTVATWRRSFLESGVEGILHDLPRGGRKPSARKKVAAEIIRKTNRERPKNATHWSTLTLAREVGTNSTMIHRVWKADGLKPHRVKTFKLSNDPHFTEKLLDAVKRFFRELTDKRIRRGVFTSFPKLEAEIMSYVDHYNSSPKSFTWTAKAKDIMAKVERARAVLISTKQNETLHQYTDT